jgi:3beta-hydroxy-delta5-steroid dehydrogenase/steroid delta-isomerase
VVARCRRKLDRVNSSNVQSATGRKAVVIGGSGFLGKRLVAFLAGDEARASDPDGRWPSFDHVHVFDREAFPPRAAGGTAPVVTSQVGDICSRHDLREALADADTVFHLASIVDVGLKKNPRIDAVNVEGTRNVVELCQELGVPYLVYTSSEDVVLSPTPVANGDESIPYPTTVVHDYVRTKIEGEKLVRAADGRGGLRTCCIRPVHLYGPHDPHAIKISLSEIARGKLPFLLGDGSARFDIVYVDNVVHAHLLAATCLREEGTRDAVGGRAYFIGEGNAPNYFEFIRPYADAKGIAMPKRHAPLGALWVVARLMELAHRAFAIDVPFHSFHLYVLGQDFYFSNANAEKDLGYRPLVSPEEGQRRTIEWIVAEPLDV